MVLDFIQTIRRTLGKHDQLGIANKMRRQPITTTLVSYTLSPCSFHPTHQGHVFLLQALHSVRLTIVSHQNLLNVGLAVEYLSAKLDIRDDTVVSVVLQGSFQGGVPPRRIDAEKNFLGVTMGAVMELIPRITALFIDGVLLQTILGRKADELAILDSLLDLRRLSPRR